MNRACLIILWSFALPFGFTLTSSPGTPLQGSLGKLQLPGITLNLEERCVDVDAEVCLHDGLLELLACTPDTKEHESVVVLKARPMHIHTALLLFGAEPGSPAGQKRFGEGGGQWVPVPPSGGQVTVSFVFAGKDGKLIEHPASQFIEQAGHYDFDGTPLPREKVEVFPSEFIFAGSQLVEDGLGPRKYVADYSGNVISISTFGDELLCLPGIYGHQNGGLSWQVNPKGLPPVGGKVTLRIRPKKNPPKPE